MKEANKIYDALVNEAKLQKGGKIKQPMLEKLLMFVEPKTANDITIKLDKNGFIHRTSNLPKLLSEFKRVWDSEGLEQLQKRGTFVFTPSDKSFLDCITENNGRLFCESEEYMTNGKSHRDLIHPTINNGNESQRQRTIEAKKNMEKLNNS